jgi:4-hydroxybenzoate polyprenyltransferase
MSALVTYGKMIKFTHTIFALPFALAALVLAMKQYPVTYFQGILIILCMVGARSSAMGMNRLLDRHYDGRNPRTQDRALPAGSLTVPAAWIFTLGSALGFIGCAALLGPLILKLSPVALAIVWGYSLAKRFTTMSHLLLGMSLALAPAGVWIALTGGWSHTATLLCLGVGSWSAGFDLIYSCQDAEFDRDIGLHSIPARWGVATALNISSVLHVLTVGFLIGLGVLQDFSWPYFIGMCVIAGILMYEHRIVQPDDLSRVDKAFFDLNGYVSVLFFVLVVISS